MNHTAVAIDRVQLVAGVATVAPSSPDPIVSQLFELLPFLNLRKARFGMNIVHPGPNDFIRQAVTGCSWVIALIFRRIQYRTLGINFAPCNNHSGWPLVSGHALVYLLTVSAQANVKVNKIQLNIYVRVCTVDSMNSKL